MCMKGAEPSYKPRESLVISGHLCTALLDQAGGLKLLGKERHKILPEVRSMLSRPSPGNRTRLRFYLWTFQR